MRGCRSLSDALCSELQARPWGKSRCAFCGRRSVCCACDKGADEGSRRHRRKKPLGIGRRRGSSQAILEGDWSRKREPSKGIGSGTRQAASAGEIRRFDIPRRGVFFTQSSPPIAPRQALVRWSFQSIKKRQLFVISRKKLSAFACGQRCEKNSQAGWILGLKSGIPKRSKSPKQNQIPLYSITYIILSVFSVILKGLDTPLKERPLRCGWFFCSRLRPFEKSLYSSTRQAFSPPRSQGLFRSLSGEKSP